MGCPLVLSVTCYFIICCQPVKRLKEEPLGDRHAQVQCRRLECFVYDDFSVRCLLLVPDSQGLKGVRDKKQRTAWHRIIWLCLLRKKSEIFDFGRDRWRFHRCAGTCRQSRVRSRLFSTRGSSLSRHSYRYVHELMGILKQHSHFLPVRQLAMGLCNLDRVPFKHEYNNLPLRCQRFNREIQKAINHSVGAWLFIGFCGSRFSIL